MSLTTRFRSLFARQGVERDLNEELEHHIEMKTQENIEAGMPPEEARYAALRAFGGVEQKKEECRDAGHIRWLEDFIKDMQYGLRQLRRNPGFTAVAVITLALGIGANAAMFSVVSAVMLRPLPYPQSSRLVSVTGAYPKGAIASLQADSRTLDLAAYTTNTAFNLTGQGEAVRLTGSAVSANLFSVLGAGAEIGRTFQPGEDRPGRGQTAILSDALWKKQFGGDPAILGRVVRINGDDRQVIGVMPPSFAFPSADAQLWLPLDFDSRNSFDYWNTNFMPLIGRLRAGATLGQAQSELHPLILRSIVLFPYVMPRSWNANAMVIPLQQAMVSGVQTRLLVLQFAVAFILLIACANVAGLLLSRAAARQKEMALRAALGAVRGRILRQLLTESVILGLAGGALGLVLASGAPSILKLALPANMPDGTQITMNGAVLAFTALLAIAAGLVFGLVPALTASKVNLAETLKIAGRRSAGSVAARVRSALIVGQVALAVVLTVSAGLLISSLWRLAQVNPGFDPEQIVTVRVSPNASLCAQRTACVALYNELMQLAHGLTGVSEVAAANTVPLDGRLPEIPAEIEGHPILPGVKLGPMLWAGAVTPGYFSLMRIPLLEGRTFRDTDTAQSEPVVVVTAAMARKFWPGQNPIGKHLRPVWSGEPWRTVVGVVSDVRQYNLANQQPAGVDGAFYMPYPQAVNIRRELPTAMTLLIRTRDGASGLAPKLHELVASVNPNVPVGEVQTMEETVSASTSQSRSMTWLFVSFAGVAILLAAVGIYGVISHSTSQRTFEIAIRLAVGARRWNIFALVLSQCLRLALVGVAIGAGASLVVTRMLSTFLYGTTATDPAIFAMVAGLIILTALLAGFMPARRATKVDPIEALRRE
ncbi:MAG TPA: ABC transporter permease [Terriglobia bacterium]|nr:ABC transporter permease [Terriglobia bacterium]